MRGRVKLHLSWKQLESRPWGGPKCSVSPSYQSLPLYSLFFYLSSLRVLQTLGTIHIQKEVLQQGLCFLQIPGVLWLELKSLVLLVIGGILETREAGVKKPG